MKHHALIAIATGALALHPLLGQSASAIASAGGETPQDMVVRIITGPDPEMAYIALNPEERAVFDAEFASGMREEFRLVSPQPEQPNPRARTCPNHIGHASAEKVTYYLSFEAYRAFLDMSYGYDCNSVWNPQITGATATSMLFSYQFRGVSARTAVRDAPHRVRTKAQYNFYVTLAGATTSGCLGITVTVGKAAHIVAPDLSCRANP